MRKKLLSVVLFVILAVCVGAVTLITPVQAQADKKCDWMCRQTYFWYCCGGPGEEPGCVIVGRCE